jgi:acetyltransferase-like isoleucine patch superfamily enzyme/SAM-dependent methyltransferase
LCFSRNSRNTSSRLKDLGHKTVITQEILPGHQHIVLGSNLLSALSINLPRDSILYNLEQISPDSPWFNDSLLHEFKKFPVWDYSLKNIEALEKLGIRNVQHVPVGYTTELTRIPQRSFLDQDIDILFYGSLNERRQNIIHGLKEKGLKVESLFEIYGEERDQFISRSKIILNVHFYDSKIFEIARLSYLFANQKFIISENSPGDPDADFFRDGLVFADYDRLVETCLEWIENHEQREEISRHGFNLIQQRQMSNYLNRAIEMSITSIPTIQSSLIKLDLGCGPRKAPGYIGVDIYPASGVDIVADLTQRFPFDDNSADEVRAHDTIEHLPDRIHTMNEIWRICKPDAIVDLFVPSTDGRGAFQDPTHISFWNLNSFQYFTVENPPYLDLCRQYGFKGAFSLVELKQYESPEQVIHVHAVLKVVKDECQPIANALSKLRDINFILFPDWTQSEETLFADLKTLLQFVAQIPQSQSLALFLDTSGYPEQDVSDIESLLSYICMELALSEDLDLSECGPEICIMTGMDYTQWDDLTSHIVGRLVLPHENQAAIAALRANSLPTCLPDDLPTFLSARQTATLAKVPWLSETINDERIIAGAYTYSDGPINFVVSNPKDRISIGKFCAIAKNVSIFGGEKHHLNRVTTYPLRFLLLQPETLINEEATTKGHTQIGNDVWIGQGATILSGVSIGDGAVIEAETVVTQNVPAYTVVVGNPGKVIQHRFKEETIQHLLNLQWWDWPIEKILANIDFLYGDPDCHTDWSSF